jgi:hypothetical protein
MGILQVDDITEGMTLASDVCTFNGSVMMKAGVVLTEKHIQGLRMLGIQSVDIEGVHQSDIDYASAGDVAPEIEAAVVNELDSRFSKTDLTDPVMREIYRLVKKERISKS